MPDFITEIHDIRFDWGFATDAIERKYRPIAGFVFYGNSTVR